MGRFAKIIQANRDGGAAVETSSESTVMVPESPKEEGRVAAAERPSTSSHRVATKRFRKARTSKRQRVEAGEFTQIGVYIAKDLHWRVKTKLLSQRGEMDLSDLVGHLLNKWVESNK